MAPVIWGLNLAEIKWSKFKSSYMWNNEYHLRRTKFIIYQCAMIFCVVSESLGTATLSDYLDQQDFAAQQNPKAYIHNNDYIGAGSYNIFVGVYIATIFGAAFFFDLFWPERHESPAVRLAWRINAVFASIACLSTALTLTIITATHRARVTGVPDDEGQRVAAGYKGDAPMPLQYRKNPRAIAAVVFIWPGFVSTVASTVLLFYSLAHIEKYGPKSTHARDAEKAAYVTEDGETSTAGPGRETTSAAEREPATAPGPERTGTTGSEAATTTGVHTGPTGQDAAGQTAPVTSTSEPAAPTNTEETSTRTAS